MIWLISCVFLSSLDGPVAIHTPATDEDDDKEVNEDDEDEESPMEDREEGRERADEEEGEGVRVTSTPEGGRREEPRWMREEGLEDQWEESREDTTIDLSYEAVHISFPSFTTTTCDTPSWCSDGIAFTIPNVFSFPFTTSSSDHQYQVSG
jgi:hypothetical protein